MPVNTSVVNHLKEVEKDNSKILGLSLNGKTIENGAFVGKAGTSKGHAPPQLCIFGS